MKRTFTEAMKHRRTCYAIGNHSPISNEEIENILQTVVMHVPSAFNSQSARLVLLLGNNHKQFWQIVKETLRHRVGEKAFKATEAKIDGSFASGYGTVLFFEDQHAVEELQEAFPAYKENFPVWSQHTSAMHQFAVWLLLEDAGFGASLQHYNPLIDEEVLAEWELPPSWKLVAQMPFGNPLAKPGEKEFAPLEDRLKVFK